MTPIRLLASAATALVLLACTNPPKAPVPATNQQASIAQTLEEFGQAYRSGQWDRVQHYFSSSYPGGYAELRRQLEQKWRSERLLDLRLQLGRVLENDGLLNVQLRWDKSYSDSLGVIQKKSGTSELVLRPQNQRFIVLKIDGISFLD